MATEELNALKNYDLLYHQRQPSQMDRRRKLVELYQGGIIPQAEQSLESAVISYRVNKVDFLTLLDGRVNLFNYERELYESQAEYMMKLASSKRPSASIWQQRLRYRHDSAISRYAGADRRTDSSSQ